jgi:hypothetical protein
LATRNHRQTEGASLGWRPFFHLPASGEIDAVNLQYRWITKDYTREPVATHLSVDAVVQRYN